MKMYIVKRKTRDSVEWQRIPAESAAEAARQAARAWGLGPGDGLVIYRCSSTGDGFSHPAPDDFEAGVYLASGQRI